MPPRSVPAPPIRSAGIWSAIDSRALDLAILLAIPLAQAVINKAWMFSPMPWLDPWYYFGYGLSYDDPSFLPTYYKVSRLPWILYEFISRRVFDPVSANWFIQISTLWIGIGSLYLAFSRLFGRMPAFFGAGLFALNCFGHASGGADYQNTLAGPLFALTLWLTIRAAQEGGRALDIMLAGVAAALLVHTNVVFVNLTPPLVVGYVLIYRQKTGRIPPVILTALFAVLGALLITGVLGLINLSFGRRFFFFESLLLMVTSFVSDSSNQKGWWNPWSNGWYWSARHLGPIIGATLVSILVLSSLSVQRRALSVIDQNVAWLAGSGLYAFLLWLGWQIAGHTALDFDYFAYPLVWPLTGVLLAALVRWVRFPDSAWTGLALKLVFVVLGFVPWLFFDSYFNRVYNYQNALFLAPALMLAGIAIAAVAGRWAVSIPFVLSPIILALMVGVAHVGNFKIDACTADYAFIKTLDRAHRNLRTFGYPHEKVLVWADTDEVVPLDASCIPYKVDLPMKRFNTALTSTGFGYLASPWDAENLADIKPQRLIEVIAANSLVVYATNREERVAQLVATLERLGGVVTPKAVTVFGAGQLRIKLHVMTVAKRN